MKARPNSSFHCQRMRAPLDPVMRRASQGLGTTNHARAGKKRTPLFHQQNRILELEQMLHKLLFRFSSTKMEATEGDRRLSQQLGVPK